MFDQGVSIGERSPGYGLLNRQELYRHTTCFNDIGRNFIESDEHFTAQ
jgi:hypothetical protein